LVFYASFLDRAPLYLFPMPIAKLNRTVLRISGEGVTDWLSGLITNNLDSDINFAALLTPQGKIIADFFVVKDADDWLIDAAEQVAEALKKRLSMYKLRAPITIEDTDLNVHAVWDGQGSEGYEDPREPRLGHRLYGASLEGAADAAAYDLHRLSLGVPDSQYDFESSEAFPAGANMDRLSGVDFKKGCFVGQEVVSRMYRKTEVKKRMRGFSFEGGIEGTKITAGERTIGDVLHTHNGLGMAMIRHDRLPEDDLPLMIGETEINLLELPNGSPQAA